MLRRAAGARPDRAGLSREQRRAVARAVRQGRAADDPGLRTVAVAHARYHQRLTRVMTDTRTARWFLVVAACFSLAGVVLGALRHQPVTALLGSGLPHPHPQPAGAAATPAPDHGPRAGREMSRRDDVVLLAVIAVIAVGAPAAALLADRRLGPPRRWTGVDPEAVLLTLRRTHGLTADEVAQVRAAVQRGVAVEPRLRPVAFGYATALLPRPGRYARWARRHRRAVGLAVVLVPAAAVGFSLVTRQYTAAAEIFAGTAYSVGSTVYTSRRTGAVRRARTLAAPTDPHGLGSPTGE